jgi:hypothetical protein
MGAGGKVSVVLQRKWLSVAAAALVCLYFADRLALTPLANMWTARGVRIAELRKDIAEARSLLDRAEALERRWDQMLGASFPADEAEAEGLVLGSVNAWAAGAGLQISALRPRWSGESGVRVLECRATGFGTMRQVAGFIHAIETSPLALKIEETGLTSGDASGSRINMDLRFTGLVLREETP